MTDGKILTEFAALRLEIYSYTTDYNNKSKKPTCTKRVGYKSYRKNKFNVEILKENCKEFIKTIN